MTSFQKVIKYFAIAFACFIIVSIISGILVGIGFIRDIHDDKDDDKTTTTSYVLEESKAIEINIRSANLEIRKGDQLLVENSNKYINVSQNKDYIKITERKHSLFKHNNSKLIIYVPEDMIFDSVNIDSGAANLDIETLKVKELKMDVGAGNFSANNIEVSKYLKIDGGAGNIEIKNGIVNDFNLNLGFGNFDGNLKLTGKNEIDCGVGNVELTVLGNIDDYTLDFDKGIGSLKLDNKKISDDYQYGNGQNKLSVSGGVGDININFITQSER